MNAAKLIAFVAAVSATGAYAAEPATYSPMGDKSMPMQKMEKCEGMKSDDKAGAKSMDCKMDDMSGEHMKQMHEHMHQMQSGGMMGGGGQGMGGMQSGAAPKAAPAKAATQAPADQQDHSAHHP